MKDEYIIINKTALEKRIEELETEILYYHKKKEHLACKELSRIKSTLEEILSQSIPLVPEIEKAFDAGKNYGEDCANSDMGVGENYPNKQEYIQNLKLEI